MPHIYFLHFVVLFVNHRPEVSKLQYHFALLTPLAGTFIFKI